MSTISVAIDHLKAAYDAISSADVESNPTLAAVRFACRLGLDAATGVPTPKPEIASYGIPGSRKQKWLLRFEDADVGDIVYDATIYGEAEAELLAREAYARATQNWNCHLLHIATLDPAENVREAIRANALESALREIKSLLEQGNPEDRKTTASLLQADIALGDVEPEDAPFLSVATALKSANAKHLAEIQRKVIQHEQKIARDKKYHDLEPNPKLSKKDRELDAMVAKDLAEKGQAMARELEVAQSVSASWKDGGKDLLLPLGSTVKVLNSETLPVEYPLPKAGIIGVVTGYSTLRSRHNTVSFVGDVPMTAYEDFHGDEDRQVHFNYLAQELEVIEHGIIMDTHELVQSPGWRPTHGHGTKGEILYSESMAIRANGMIWRIQPCSGPPECTQVAQDTPEGRDRFKHLIMLDEHFNTEGNTAHE